MSKILTIENIEKTYGSIKALQNVSFNINSGSVFGILGPNGSGKTTLLGILLDVLQADKGNYTWHEYKDAQTARKHIGSLLETPNFYHYLSAGQNLEITAKIKGRGENEIDSVLQQVNLLSRKDFPFQSFSLGMKQRLAIAAALLGKPDILVLDEPTNGLDPVGISEIRELIVRLSNEGTTVIMASHLLDEVEKVCTDVAILQKGVLLSAGNVSEVLNDDDWIEVGTSDLSSLENLLKKHPALKHIRKDKFLHCSFTENISAEQLNKFCAEQGIYINHLQKRKRSLESKFMELTSVTN